MKLSSEKCLSVLYFTSNENVKRYQYIGETVVAFVPQPEDQHAAFALSAFIKGMNELNTVAIVRYCFRKNVAPKLGFLSPHIKQDYECLLFTALPFLEDLRHFTFAPLNENKKWEPSGEQQDAVDNLITAMDLTYAQRDEDGQSIEALKCETTFNPVQQRVFQCIQHRALNPDDPSLPDLEPVIASYLEPSAEFKARCAPECTKVKDIFRLEKIEKKKETPAENVFKAIGDERNGEPSTSRADVHDETDFSMASLAQTEITQVGTVDPVSDVCTTISQRDEDRFDEVKEGTPGKDDLQGLAKEIVWKWKELGRRLLDSDEATLDAIHKENEEYSEKAYKMLLKWQQTKGSGAIFRVLHDALCHPFVGRKDLAERFCLVDHD